MVDLLICLALVDVSGTKIRKGDEHVYYRKNELYYVFTGMMKMVSFSHMDFLRHFTDGCGYNEIAKLRQVIDFPKIIGLEAIMSGQQPQDFSL